MTGVQTCALPISTQAVTHLELPYAASSLRLSNRIADQLLSRSPLSAYLGADPSTWAAYDASLLVAKKQHPWKILIDQGTADGFLEQQLKPQLFEAACQEAGQALELRM